MQSHSLASYSIINISDFGNVKLNYCHVWLQTGKWQAKCYPGEEPGSNGECQAEHKVGINLGATSSLPL